MKKFFVKDSHKNEQVSYKKIISSVMKIAVPISIQTTLISGLQLVDNLFIGHLNDAKYVASGVNAVSNITFIVSSLIISFIASIGIFFINSAAKKNLHQQRNIFKIKFIWVLMLSAVFLIPTSIFIKQISSLWIANNNQDAMQFAEQYGRIVVPSLFLSMFTVLFSDTFRQTKVIKVTVYISLSAFAINSVLNYVLMYIVGWGIRGTAIATIIARFIELTIWIIYFLIKKPNFIPEISSWFNISFKKVLSIFPKSSLWAMNSFMLSLGFTLKILFLSRISVDSAASLNSAGAFIQIFRGFLSGYASAIPILIIGFLAKKHQNGPQFIKEYIIKMSIVSFLFGLLVSLIGLGFSPLVYVLYPKYSLQINTQSLIMIISITLFMPIGLVLDVLVSALKGMGISKQLALTDSLFGYIVVLPVVIMLTYLKPGGVIEYGWIYAISIGLSIFKPIGLSYFVRKFIDQRRKFTFNI